MGNCCVAAAATSAHSNTQTDAATDASAVSRKAALAIGATAGYSPSWSFRWDNRTHTEEEGEEDEDGAGSGRGSRGYHNNNSSSGNMGSWAAAAVGSTKSAEIEAVSDGGSPFRYLQQPPRRHKSPSLGRTDSAVTADVSFGSNSSIEVDAPNSSKRSSILKAKSFSHTPSPPFVKADPSSSWSSLPSESSRKARRSPGYQLSRQISDSRIPVLKSLDENSPDDGRHHFHLPSYSSDISPAESHRGSSDGWSMRLFSELVASCKTRPLSYGHENFSCSPLGGTLGLSCQQPAFPQAADLNTCGVCYKLLKERPPWIAHKIMNNDAPVVAVLVCGHVYHAECLESITSELDRFDPCCPVCTDGWKPASRLSKKTDFKSKSSKISRIAVADVDLDNNRGGEHSKGAARKGPRMGASSSLKGSMSKPFLRRNFTIGSKTSCPIPESEVARKKGFWARHWKD